MRIIFTIVRKELEVYFTSPMAYIVSAVFLSLTGFFFIQSIEGAFAQASVRDFLIRSALFLLPLMPPILTMRLLAEEQKLGTLELLLTSPVKDYEVVLGKFIASFVILSATIFLTLFYVVILIFYSDPDIGPILSGYLGFLLYGAAALAIGLLASSLTGNQIVAAVVGFGIILLFTVVDQISGSLGGVVDYILGEISLFTHFESFSRGVIDTSDVIYYLLVTAVVIFITVRSLETRRWR